MARSGRLYPGQDLLRKIADAWGEPDPGESDDPLPLPPDNVLAQLLDEAYHASLLSEESRRVRFRLVYGQGQALRQEASSATVVQFDRPVDFDAEGIRRLAPATDPSQVALGVWAEPARAAGDPNVTQEAGAQPPAVQTWGLVDTGSSWARYLRGEADSSSRPPSHFTLASNEPGDLTISRAGRPLLRLRHGALTKPIQGLLQKGPVAERFRPAVDKLAQAVAGTMPEAAASPVGQSWIQRVYLDSIRRLLLGIRDLGHGGAILIVPETWAPDGPEFRQRLRVKFPCNEEQLWDRAVAQILSKLQPGGASPEVAERLSDKIQFISNLSAVDGAVLLTDRLRLLGFGAEIIVTSDDLKTVRKAKDSVGPPERHVEIDSFGTRHRSAFRFCHQDPDALAFIMSQDGGIKAVKRIGDEVVLWSDIDVETGFDVETSTSLAPSAPGSRTHAEGGGE